MYMLHNRYMASSHCINVHITMGRACRAGVIITYIHPGTWHGGAITSGVRALPSLHAMWRVHVAYSVWKTTTACHDATHITAASSFIQKAQLLANVFGNGRFPQLP